MKSTYIFLTLSLKFPNFLCNSIYKSIIEPGPWKPCPPTEVWSITAGECVPDDDDSGEYYEYVEESVENHCNGYNEVWDIVKKKCVQLFNDSSEEIRKTTTKYSSSGLTLSKTSLSMSILFLCSVLLL